ncbi:unnamed protein product [Adineta steineri]|uniref:Chloride channel CLIC-like protein 1 n=2 Tax=Adineta steineri TaxID=433720 RepID=A0A815I7Q2_9BILA|nr:unnamed protein product [Adineta steineri]
MTRCIIFYLLLTTFCVGSQDIYDMFNDVKDQVIEKVDYASTKVKEKVQKHVQKLKDGGTCSATHTTEYRTVLTAYRHVVKDWLEKFPSKDGKDYRLLVELSASEFNRLNQFASSTRYEEKDVLHEIHVISDLLKRMVYQIEDTTYVNSLSWSGWLRSFDINTIIKSVLVLISIGAISFISIRTHLRRGRWFTTFFIVTFIVSVIQNWYTLYQEAQAKVDEVLMKKLPKHCQGQSMGFFDMIKSKLGNFVQLPTNECLEYHKALRATPHSQVTPVQALSMTFAQLFVTPLGTIGESLSQFFAGTMRHVPFMLWPIIILLILFIVLVLILMYSRYEIHLPFMMGSLRPSPHAAISRTTQIIEQLEGSSNNASHAALPRTTRTTEQIEDSSNRSSRAASPRRTHTTEQIEDSSNKSRHAALPPTTTHITEQIEDSSNKSSRAASPTRTYITQQTEDSPKTSSDIGFKQEFLPN